MHRSYVGVHGTNVKQLLRDYRDWQTSILKDYILLEIFLQRIQSLINIGKKGGKKKKGKKGKDKYGVWFIVWAHCCENVRREACPERDTGLAVRDYQPKDPFNNWLAEPTALGAVDVSLSLVNTSRGTLVKR